MTRYCRGLLEALVELGDLLDRCTEREAEEAVDAVYRVATGKSKMEVVRCRRVIITVQRTSNGLIVITP